LDSIAFQHFDLVNNGFFSESHFLGTGDCRKQV
jgi:hypothetical protein